MDDQAPINLVKPSHYDLELRNLDFKTWKYDGIVSITVEFIQPSRSITINASHLEFKNAQVLVDGNVALTTKATSFDCDDKMQVVRINLNDEIPATKSATITIAFQGEISDSLAGFYRSKYKPVVQQAASVAHDDDGSHYALSTQFEASYARRAFPCFDVPNLKATFALTIEVPSDQVVLSNMPVRSIKPNDDRAGWNAVSFETTPIMSTYLLAWAVGDFAYVEAFTDQFYNGRRIPVRVYATRGVQSQGQFAVTIAPRVIDLFSGVFDIPYPLDKLDILAVPEMSMTSMEHWGLITSQPSELLLDSETSSEAVKQDIADNISHELAHQWFGNLVTMDWWDELWLNESFATWAGHYAVDQLFPEWDIWAQFVVGRMEDAFQADGLRSSHAVHIPMSSGLQDHQIFDQISYGKGCAVIRMLVEYVGVGKFLAGVSSYLKANAYGNATAHVLWENLEAASGKGIVKIAESWINTVGYPVVTVTEIPSKGQILLRQSRFLTSGDVKSEDDTALWCIPLGITGIDCDQDVFLSEREQVISGIDLGFYKLNAHGTGFYRVAYPPRRLALLSTQLNRLCASERCSMIGSAAALASAGSGSAASLLSFLQGFRRENHAIVWQQVLDALQNVEMAFSEDAEMSTGLKRFALQLIEDKVNDVGIEALPEDNFLTRRLRRTLLGKAVKYGHAGTVSRFASIFSDWTDKGIDIDPSMRRIVLRAAMRKEPIHVFPILMSEFTKTSSSDTKNSILLAMAETDDKSILRDLVAFNWSSSVPVSEMSVLLFALVAHPIGRHVQWAYTKDHWEACAAKLNDALLLDQFVQVSLLGFSSEDVVKDVDAFFADKNTEGFRQSLEKGKEGIRAKALYRERDSALLKQFLLENKYL